MNIIKKNVTIITMVLLLAATTFSVFAFDFPVDRLYQVSSLPRIQYLGEGPGTFTLPAGDAQFLVKLPRANLYREEPGPTFTTTVQERVWSIDRDVPGNGIAVFDNVVDLNQTVTAGCVVDYVQIDDDLDDRRNRFLIGNDEVHMLAQGMVVYGSFVADRDGPLLFRADDSVGLVVLSCQQQATPTPTPTTTVPASPTPTGTVVPPTVPPGTAEPTAIPTNAPREKGCLRINFEVSGDSARRGLYIVQEIGGIKLAEWYAEEGWQDSGWFQGIELPFEAVHVEVLYYAGPGVAPVVMKIVNPAPGTPYGWAARGMCHAIEVGWP